ncbi:MAG TPA: ABC transporter substrate-binding protein, partial [Solirubrobacteraceae bacterium]
FTPNGVHAGIYLAMERGYDEAEGVTLQVDPPSSSTDSVKLLLSGRTDLAILDIHDLALAREKGRDIVGVMALVQAPLAAILAQPSVRRPRDLEGRRVGVTGLPSDDAVLRSTVKGAGGRPGRVHEVDIGFNAVKALLARRVAAATAFWNVEGVELRKRMPGAREFRVDEFGAPPYPELVLTATRATVDTNPALVAATVRALVRGYRFTLTDPDSSAEDVIAENAGLDRVALATQLGVLDAAFVGASGRFGTFDLAALRQWARWEARFGIVRRPPDVGRMFAPRFAAQAASEQEG